MTRKNYSININQDDNDVVDVFDVYRRTSGTLNSGGQGDGYRKRLS